jgi:hypothetical protein
LPHSSQFNIMVLILSFKTNKKSKNKICVFQKLLECILP